MASVLIVEDNVALATCLEMLLEAHFYEVTRASDGRSGLESIKLMDFDVILCDLVMPGLTGDRLLAAAEQLKPHLCDRFIFMSGHAEPQWAEFASQTGRPIFWKPFHVQDLLDAIKSLVHTNTTSGREMKARSQVPLTHQVQAP